MISFVFVSRMAPETKGRPLEAIRVLLGERRALATRQRDTARVDRLRQEEQLTKT